jgi:hypothetical protein
MKLALSSIAVANTSQFLVGITGAIVSKDAEAMLLAVPASSYARGHLRELVHHLRVASF